MYLLSPSLRNQELLERNVQQSQGSLGSLSAWVVEGKSWTTISSDMHAKQRTNNFMNILVWFIHVFNSYCACSWVMNRGQQTVNQVYVNINTFRYVVSKSFFSLHITTKCFNRRKDTSRQNITCIWWEVGGNHCKTGWFKRHSLSFSILIISDVRLSTGEEH